MSALPDATQLVQEFTAAILKASNNVKDAKRLIEYLASSEATVGIRKIGMEPVRDHQVR